MSSVYCSIPNAIEEISRGNFLIVTDRNDREDEGDLIMPAELVTAEKINFMTTFGKGLICTPLTEKKAKLLRLPLMVPPDQNEEYTKCSFTLPVDAKKGIRSGISASDRATTIQLLSSDKTGAADLVRPGHIFPLIAKNGGLRERDGHTEASIELCRLANKKPVGVICEIIGDTGEMLRGAELKKFAQKHKLKIISIAQILEYLEHEKS